VELNLVGNSESLEIHRRGGHVPLNKHEVTGASYHGMISRLDVMCPPNNRDRPHVILQPQSDLSDGNASQPIKTRCYRGAFSNRDDLGRYIGRHSHRILESKQGAERCCGLTDPCSGHPIHYDVSRFVYRFMLVECKVERFEPVVAALSGGGGGLKRKSKK